MSDDERSDVHAELAAALWIEFMAWSGRNPRPSEQRLICRQAWAAVARLGREFYERLATFADYFDDVRKKLDGAVQAYNTAVGSFEGRVLVSARRPAASRVRK